jgi:hypothetical protein
MSLAYFGEQWDAPAWDDGVLVPAPVGEDCLHCAEPIEEGDSGVLVGHMRRARPGETPMGRMASGEEVVSLGVPHHLECHLRLVLGTVAHLEGRCLCVGGTEPESTLSARDEARASLAWLRQRQRQRQRQRPSPSS